jgi:hypothetical protein
MVEFRLLAGRLLMHIYTVMKNGVQEGVVDGTFKQLGILSRTAETNRERKQQQEEIFRQLSGQLNAKQRESDMRHDEL